MAGLSRLSRGGALVAPLAFLAAWQFLPGVLGVDRMILPTPSEIVGQLVATREIAWEHTLHTLAETVTGFTASAIVALAVAVLMDQVGWLKRGLYPMLVASQTIPIIAIAPLMIIWFGFGLLPKVLVVVLVTFFPIVVAVLDGFASTDPDAERLLRTMGASRRQVFLRARVPSALPGMFTGMRISVSYAVTAAVVAEYVGAERGLGIWMQQSKAAFQTDLVFGAMLVTALISTTLFLLVNAIAHLAIPWHYAQRRRA